jgi:GTPase SAR1 family protein
MPTDATQGFSDLTPVRDAAQKDALDAIRELTSIADGLMLKDTSAMLAEIGTGLESNTFKMIVMGRFKNGKSTLINALMGGTTKPVSLGGALGPMVVDDLPATAVLSEVNYSDVPFIKAWNMDGHADQWTLAQYLGNSTLGDDSQENERRFREIRHFEIGFPARLCESRVTLYDSPGLDENPIRTSISMDAVRSCDAALIVYGSRALMGEKELVDDLGVRAGGTHVFVVVNLFDGRQVDDRLRGYVWNKYVRDHLHGPAWDGQDLADYGIYFVNAKMAVDARYGTGGQQAYRDSGLAALEQRLTRFLIEERLAVHLRSFTRKAINLSNRLLQNVSQQQAAVTADRDTFRAAWEQQQKPLQDLRERPARLPRIIDRYRNEAIIDLTSSFTTLVAGIRRDLQAHLEAAPLPTAQTKVLTVWHQKKLMNEAVDEINSFIKGRIADWSTTEADGRLRDVAERLSIEVTDEVTDIGRRFDTINMALTGWDSATLGKPGNVHSTTERVVATIAGLVFGGGGAAVGGGAGGYRGALGGIIGAGAAGWLLISVLGITSGIVFAPIIAVAALFAAIGGSLGLVERIKKKALEPAQEKLAALPSEVSAKITADLATRFGAIQTAITAEVTAFIDEQARNVETQVQLSQQQETEQERTLEKLKATERDVLKHRKTLEDAVMIAKQV